MAVGSASCGAVGRRQPRDTLVSAGRYWCSFAFFTSVLSCSPPTHAQPEFKDAGIPVCMRTRVAMSDGLATPSSGRASAQV